MNTQLEQLYIADVDFPEAKRLADIASILRDLQATRETCKRLMDLLDSQDKDSILLEGLWSAALVRYTRCFAFGKRYGLTEEVFDGLEGDPVGTHRWYKSMRDKHVAHSVNPYEQVRVGLVLSPEKSEQRRVLGVSTLAGVYICPEKEGVRQLGMLTTVLLRRVAEMGKECEAQVIEVAKTLPIEDLYKRATSRVVAPGPETAGRPRDK
jgi:hypothetical protein